MCLSTILDIITTGFLLGTLIVISIYTYQTYKLRQETTNLRQETTRQTELSLRPFIIISVFKDMAGLAQRLVYKNIGHSPALDVETESFDAETYILNFKKWGLVEIGEMQDLNPKGELKPGKKDAYIQAGPPLSFTPKELNKRNNDQEFIFNIHYKNIEKVSYQTQAKISRKGIEIISTGKI